MRLIKRKIPDNLKAQYLDWLESSPRSFDSVKIVNWAKKSEINAVISLGNYLDLISLGLDDSQIVTSKGKNLLSIFKAKDVKTFEKLLGSNIRIGNTTCDRVRFIFKAFGCNSLDELSEKLTKNGVIGIKAHPNEYNSSVFDFEFEFSRQQFSIEDRFKMFNEIFENSTIKAVVVTHPDKDHYNCLEYLFNKIAPAKECIFVVGRNNEADYELLDKKSKKVIYAVEDDQRCNEANGDLTTALFGSADSVGTVEIIKPVQVIKASDTNSHSLILKVTYDNQSILFTGDATKNTFKTIYGDAKADDETQKNLSIKNRLALKSINFLIAPHHGASTDESNLWLMHVNKKNPYNFVGVIFCAPDDIQKSSSEEEQPKQNTSLYGHPGNYIDNIHFENTTFAHKFRYHYGAKQYPRTKDSHEPIWVTGLTTHAYWLQLSSETGMQIFNDHDGEFHALLSKDGWSPKMQPIFEDLKKATVPDATWTLLLQEPRKWKCRNGKGQTLSEALYADDSENYKENISKNINTYLEIIKNNDPVRSDTLPILCPK